MLPQDQTQKGFINPGMFVLCLDGLTMTLLHSTDKFTLTVQLANTGTEMSRVGQRLSHKSLIRMLSDETPDYF